MLAPKDIEEILARPAGRRTAMLLAGCGFAVPRQAAPALAGLAGHAGFRELLPALLDDLTSAADPDAALAGLAGLIEASDDELRAKTVARLAADPEARKVLLALLGSSRAFSATLARWPEWVDAVIAPGAVERARSVQELSGDLAAMLGDAPDLPAALSALRRFRRREMLRIAARDLAGRADLAAVTSEISAVADAVVAGALEVARRECSRQWAAGSGRKAEDGGQSAVDGEPSTAVCPACSAEAAAPAAKAGPPTAHCRLAVLAMGKLGGAELNYSSDIDLLFITDRASPDVTCLGEQLIRALDEPTGEGVAFRTDLRLRPEGSLGPLVAELGPALDYYRERARPWERQALVKCRLVAGDAELASEFLGGVEEFVWGSGLSVAELARAAALRAEMERAAESNGAVEVKSGVGGIRDAEFSVQLLQLAHGAADPGLRRAGTLAALAALEAAGIVSRERSRTIRAGYEFLRRVEHALQTMEERQLHALPSSPAELAALARRLGYAGSSEAARTAFEKELAAHSAALRAIYTELCGEGASGEDLAGKLRAMLAPGAAEEDLVAMLRLMGFGAGRRAAGVVRAMTAGAGGAPETLAPVLERLRGGTDPERGLANLERIAAAAGGGELLARLAADSRLRDGVLAVAERSDYLSALLAELPDQLELHFGDAAEAGVEVVDAIQVPPSPGGPPADPAAVAAWLARMNRKVALGAGLRDLLGGAPIEETSAELSAQAERALLVALRALGARPGLAALGLGKLGGRELSYGSDLDLVFVFTGAEPEAGDERTAQEALRLLAASGYEVDTRLRPAGSKGQLVASLAGYRAYRDRGELASWERLALVRARPVHGAAPAREELSRFLTETLYGAEPPATLASEVWAMRLRLESTAEAGDFKRGSGGLADLEFLAQYLALAHGWREPTVRRTGTEAVFTAAATARILAGLEAQKAIDAHRFLRRLEMRARVLEGRPVTALPADPAALESLARRMGLASGGTLRAEFEAHTGAARSLLRRTLGT